MKKNSLNVYDANNAMRQMQSKDRVHMIPSNKVVTYPPEREKVLIQLIIWCGGVR